MPDAWPWGIAAACFGVAIAAILRCAETKADLDAARKRLAQIEGELASLKAARDKEKGGGVDKPPPISYPPSGKVT